MNNHEVTHLYQPIVDLADLRLVRHEALLRIEGIEDIEAYTRSLEASGDIIELDLLTLETVLRHLEDPALPSNLPVAVNVSARSLGSDRFQRKAVALLQNSPASLDISVEITESSPIVNVEGARDFVRTVQNLGCTVGMDDYGDGFAYLDLVGELHLDYLKISSVITQHVLEDDESIEKINTAMHYALDRGIKVVAEHIDNLPQYLLLRDLGIHHGQGWLFAKADAMIEDPEKFQDSLKSRIYHAIGHLD